MFSTLQANTVWEHQHSDGRSEGEIFQDAGTATAHQIIGDVSVASNQELRRGLQKVVPRTTTIQYRESGGATKPMTLDQARKAAKKKVGVDQQPAFFGNTHACPTQHNFYRNNSAKTPTAAVTNGRTELIPDANRARRNRLSQEPLVIDVDAQQQQQEPAGITPGSSVMSVDRVRKRAKQMVMDGNTTPKSKSKSVRIYRALAGGDPTFTTAAQDCCDAPDSVAAVKTIGMLCFDDEEKDD